MTLIFPFWVVVWVAMVMYFYFNWLFVLFVSIEIPCWLLFQEMKKNPEITGISSNNKRILIKHLYSFHTELIIILSKYIFNVFISNVSFFEYLLVFTRGWSKRNAWRANRTIENDTNQTADKGWGAIDQKLYGQPKAFFYIDILIDFNEHRFNADASNESTINIL